VSAPRSYLPGLDGLRAVAVLGVLGYHSGWTWLSGGFAGVSLFLTLSGFLITRLLVVEHEATGTLDLGRFWARRARRLLPAAFAAVVLAVAVTAAVGTASQGRDLLGDTVASVLYVANWRFALDPAGYAGLYEAPSALQHLWSLAVEEQLYLLVPLTLAGALAAGRGRGAGRWPAAVALATLAAASVAVAALATAAGWSLDALYYGTHVRAAELLVGALLALATAGRHRTAPAVVRHLGGPVALAVVGWTWTSWNVTDESLYRGGLAGHAVVVAVVLWAVTSGPSGLTWLLERAPLRWLGRRSYGTYLYHWPLFVLAEQSGLDVPRGVLLAGAWAGAVGLAAVSYTALEQPIRHGRALQTRPVVGLSLLTAPVVVVLLAAVAVTPAPVHDTAATVRRLDALAARPTPAPAPAPASDGGGTTAERAATPAAPAAAAEPTAAPLRLAIFGDSIAAANGLGLAEWAVDHPALELVPGVTIPGCALVATGTRWSRDGPIPISDGCDWRRSWPSTVAEHRPDIAVVAIGALDALPWSLPDTPGRRRAGDPEVDRRIRDELDGINSAMAAAGVRVIWLTLPAPAQDNGTAPALNRINQLIERSAAASGQHVFDMAAVVARWEREGLYRSDGVHLDAEDSRRLARQHLGPALMRAMDVASLPGR
jgi:peptidoglycan/LPS O-acetylase OafA/YrhL